MQQQLNCLLHNLPKWLKWGILLLDTLFFMPAGKGTYGSKVGRPKKKVGFGYEEAQLDEINHVLTVVNTNHKQGVN